MNKKHEKAGRTLLLAVLVMGMLCILPSAGIRADLPEINYVAFRGPNLEPGITLRYLRENTYKMIPADLGDPYEHVTISARIIGPEAETLPDVDLLPDDIIGNRQYRITYTWRAPAGFCFASEMRFTYIDDDWDERDLDFYTYSQITESGTIYVLVGSVDIWFFDMVPPTFSEDETTPATTEEPTTTAEPTPTTTAEPTPTTTPAPTPPPEPVDEMVRRIVYTGAPLAPGQLPSVIANELVLVEPLDKVRPQGWRVEIQDVETSAPVPLEQPLLAKEYRLCLVWIGLPGVRIAPSEEVDMFYNDLEMTLITVLDLSADTAMIAKGDRVIDLSGVEPIIGPERFTPGGGIKYMFIR